MTFQWLHATRLSLYKLRGIPGTVYFIRSLNPSPPMDLQARHPSRYGIRSAFLPIQLVDDALLIEFPDEAHIDESLGIGGFGARVAGVPTERGTCHCVVFPTLSTLLVIRRG